MHRHKRVSSDVLSIYKNPKEPMFQQQAWSDKKMHSRAQSMELGRGSINQAKERPAKIAFSRQWSQDGINSHSQTTSPICSPRKVSGIGIVERSNREFASQRQEKSHVPFGFTKEDEGFYKSVDQKSKTGAHFFQKYKHVSMIPEEIDPQKETMGPLLPRKENSLHLPEKSPQSPQKKLKQFRIKEVDRSGPFLAQN